MLESSGEKRWISGRPYNLSGSWTRSPSRLLRSAAERCPSLRTVQAAACVCRSLRHIAQQCLICRPEALRAQAAPAPDGQLDGNPDWDDDRAIIDRPRPGQTPWRPEHQRPAQTQAGLWQKTPPGEARAPAGQRWKHDQPIPPPGENRYAADTCDLLGRQLQAEDLFDDTAVSGGALHQSTEGT